MKTIHKLIPLLLIIGMGCITNTEDLTIDPDDNGNETTVSYSATIQPIFNGNCTGCHGSNGFGGLDLRSYSNLMSSSGNNYSGRIVVSGDAEASGLVDKIEADPEFPDRMPTTGQYLSTAQIQNIRNWINQGAQNN